MVTVSITEFTNELNGKALSARTSPFLELYPNYDRSYPFYDSAYSERNHIKNDHIFLELSRLDTQQNAEVKDFGHHRNIYEIIFNSRPGKMWIKYTQIIYRYQFTLQVTQENYFSRQ